MLGERLKEERERLNFNQSEFAESCGIKRNAQIKYESGERQPKSEYLEKATKLGVDISYLFTGKRTQPVELPSDEAFLLDSFRALSNERKKMALQFLIGGFDGLSEDRNISHSVVNSPNANVQVHQSSVTA